MYRFDKLQYDHDRASLCERLLDGLMTSTAKMAANAVMYAGACGETFAQGTRFVYEMAVED
eukprot:scaffold9772_cov128-Isochrysis_galbana.AAC.11